MEKLYTCSDGVKLLKEGERVFAWTLDSDGYESSDIELSMDEIHVIEESREHVYIILLKTR